MSKSFPDSWDPPRCFLCRLKRWPHAECDRPPLRKADVGKYPQEWIFSPAWTRTFDSVSDWRRFEVVGKARTQFLEKGSGACVPAYRREAHLGKDFEESGGRVWIRGWMRKRSGMVKRGQGAGEVLRLPKLPPPGKLWNRCF